MDSKVSIIIPIYNVEEYLEQCIDSVLAQTHKEIEVILVDDGSPDNCGAICDNYSMKDSRIRVIHKKNGGLSSARNAGLDIATGEYIMFIDSDDFIEQDMVEALLTLKAESSADIVCCGAYQYSKGKQPYIIKRTVSKNKIETYGQSDALKKLILRTIDCSSCNKLYPKELIGSTRFIDGRNNEDRPFLFELYQRCNTIAYCNKVYYYYRVREGSITYQINERSFDVIKNTNELEKIIIEKNLDLKKEIKLFKVFVSILLARNIQKGGFKQKFPTEYSSMILTIKDNIFTILTNNYFSIKEKVFALMLLLRLI